MANFNQVDLNHKRVKLIINHFGHKFFRGKKILDLGAGSGDIAVAFLRLGAEILCVDARQSNLDIIATKHQFLRTQRVDLDKEWPFYFHQFDIVFSFDLLCHIKNYKDHITNIVNSAEHIFLETEVLDSIDPIGHIPIYEEKTLPELSFNGEGSLLSGTHIQNYLSEMGAQFKRIDDSKLNSTPYIYDWKEENAGRKYGHRRMWFIRRDIFTAQRLDHQKHLNALPQPPQKEPIASPSIYMRPSIIQNEAMDGKIRLFYNYYEDQNPTRKKEIDFCLQKNLENKSFETIIIDNPTNPTYNLFFEKINSIVAPNDISIICNSDIFFDETIELAKFIKHKQMYALTCWDWFSSNNIVFRNIQNSQDTWIIRGKIENVFGDFPLGKWACDNRIAYEFHKSKYKVLNPSRSIKSYHFHNSGIRRHSQRDEVSGPHLFVIPTALING